MNAIWLQHLPFATKLGLLQHFFVVTQGLEVSLIRMDYWCIPIGITLQRSISYTLALFGRHYSPTTLIHAYMQAFIQTLSTYIGELMLPIRVHETRPNPLHMVKCIGKQLGFKMISIHIVVKRLSSITKKGEIESFSFW
jgi:hypothetical protein